MLYDSLKKNIAVVISQANTVLYCTVQACSELNLAVYMWVSEFNCIGTSYMQIYILYRLGPLKFKFSTVHTYSIPGIFCFDSAYRGWLD